MRSPLYHLSQLLPSAAHAHPHAHALRGDTTTPWSYAQLRHHATRLAHHLRRSLISRGERVGICLPKSPEAVAAIHGTLSAGAAYVPVDPTAPPARSARILADARTRAVVIASHLLDPIAAAWPEHNSQPRWIVVGPHAPANSISWNDLSTPDSTSSPNPETATSPAPNPDDIAYILYTSGSTGQPKGVMLSHRAAFCFLDWCESAFNLHHQDTFSSHAPFHFDLSVFDLYAACRHAAPLVLISEPLARDPARLAPFLHDQKITVWYSAPSILALLIDHGGLDQPGRHAPRLALFAGEVFPPRPLAQLRATWRHTELWNLYGPTETNVCTAYRLPPDLHPPHLPIGHVCPPLEARVVDPFGRDLPPGETGELLIRGPGVMLGYFGQPDLTAQAFLRDAGGSGAAWYRTGDLVTDSGNGLFTFHGRRDRMIKKRGYRIELGEIEAALHDHPDVLRAAVITQESPDGLQVLAFLALQPGRNASLISLKRHCAARIPSYMIPDHIACLPDLPMTSTGKIDYPALIRMAHLHTPGRSSPHAPAA